MANLAYKKAANRISDMDLLLFDMWNAGHRLSDSYDLRLLSGYFSKDK